MIKRIKRWMGTADWREVRNGKYNMKHDLRDGKGGFPLCRHVGGLDFTGGVNFIWTSCGVASLLLL